MKTLKKTYLIISFVLFYISKLVQANIFIAIDILSPKTQSTPGFVWITLRQSSNQGILLFCNLLSMTPGTLSVDINDNKTKLLVHYMYNTKDELIEDIEDMQDKIINITT